MIGTGEACNAAQPAQSSMAQGASRMQPLTVQRDVVDCHGSDARGRPSHFAQCDHLPSVSHGHVHKAFMLTFVTPLLGPASLRSLKGLDEILPRWSLQEAHRKSCT